MPMRIILLWTGPALAAGLFLFSAPGHGRSTQSARMNVTLQVRSTCAVSATPLDLATRAVAVGRIAIDCHSDAPVAVTLDGGLNGSAEGRWMRGGEGGNPVSYALYRDAKRTVPWVAGETAPVPPGGMTIYGSVNRFGVDTAEQGDIVTVTFSF